MVPAPPSTGARHHTAVMNILDKEELKAVYYPEMERLVCEVSGAYRAVLFDQVGGGAHDFRVEDGLALGVVERGDGHAPGALA